MLSKYNLTFLWKGNIPANYFSGTAEKYLFCQYNSFLKFAQIEHMFKAIAMQHFPSATSIT